MQAKLSFQQRDVLLHLLRVYEDIEQQGTAREKRDLARVGAPWKVRSDNASQRASISRALQRLEARRLVLRNNVVSGTPTPAPDFDGTLRAFCKIRSSFDELPPKRTTHVILTEQGREIAKRLT